MNNYNYSSNQNINTQLVVKSPQIHKYLKTFESNKKSFVFAPLADAYRKAGLFKEALSVLRQGFQSHPHYAPAHLVLAQTYMDLEKYDQAFNTLKPLVKNHLENVAMQRAYAFLCKKLDKKEEALVCYRHLKFICPQDQSFHKEVEEISKEYAFIPMPLAVVREVKKGPFVFDEIWEDKTENLQNWQEESLFKGGKERRQQKHKMILENFLKKIRERKLSA